MGICACRIDASGGFGWRGKKPDWYREQGWYLVLSKGIASHNPRFFWISKNIGLTKSANIRQVSATKLKSFWSLTVATLTLSGNSTYSLYLHFTNRNILKIRTTFQIDDWLVHTPKSILAKNFGVNESVFDNLPEKDPFILPPIDVSNLTVSDPQGSLEGNSSFIYKLSLLPPQTVPGGAGTLSIIDSRNFPIAKTIAGTVVKLEPGGLRELHWHPNVSRPQIHCLFLSSNFPPPHSGGRMALLPIRSGPRNGLHWVSKLAHFWFFRGRHRRLPRQCRALYRKHIQDGRLALAGVL